MLFFLKRVGVVTKEKAPLNADGLIIWFELTGLNIAIEGCDIAWVVKRYSLKKSNSGYTLQNDKSCYQFVNIEVDSRDFIVMGKGTWKGINIPEEDITTLIRQELKQLAIDTITVSGYASQFSESDYASQFEKLFIKHFASSDILKESDMSKSKEGISIKLPIERQGSEIEVLAVFTKVLQVLLACQKAGIYKMHVITESIHIGKRSAKCIVKLAFPVHTHRGGVASSVDTFDLALSFKFMISHQLGVYLDCEFHTVHNNDTTHNNDNTHLVFEDAQEAVSRALTNTIMQRLT
jgi:hypothetical protein